MAPEFFFNLDADLNSAFDFDADPAVHSDADADPASKNDAVPDPQHCLWSHVAYGKIR